MTNNKNICIIGAGIGGLTAGALLVKNGYSVEIFEKEKMIGGRALSFKGDEIDYNEYNKLLSRFNMNIAFSKPELKTIFEKKMLYGFNLDLGYHAISGGIISNINDVLSNFNEHVDFIDSRAGLITKDGFVYPWLTKIDKMKIIPNILRLLFVNEKSLIQLDKISMSESIKKYGKGKMRLILEIFSRSITTMNNLDKISTGEMARAQRNLLKSAKPLVYPKGGLIKITKKFSDFIIENGGKIHLEKPVEKIIIKNNKAIGIFVEGKEISFDIIISNILVQDIFKIANKKYFPKNYVNKIKSFEGTGSLCAYYSLKKVDPTLIGKTFHFIERNIGLEGDDIVGMIDFMTSHPEAGLSPPNEYLVQSYVICTPEEAKNKKVLKILKEILDKNLKQIIPDFKKNLNWAIYPAIWHLDGVAKTIDKDKPEIKTPIENLYFVGDCVKAPGIGFNCAINSSRFLTDLLNISTR